MESKATTVSQLQEKDETGRVYRCIMIDPPWPEHGGGKIKRGADRHYRLLKLAEIPVVIRSSTSWRPDPTGCHLWLWATATNLPNSFALMEELGFRYVSARVWDKRPPNGQGGLKGRPGLGQYFRHEAEYLLLGVQGKLPVPPPAKRQPSTIRELPREHSRKPEQAYCGAELISPPPRLEMFARYPRSGWDCWGDEVATACGSGV